MIGATVRPEPGFESGRDAWFVRHRAVKTPWARLVCFPYAGSTATLFRDWPTSLPVDVEVAAVQLPGRAHRIREAPLRDVGAVVTSVCAALEPDLDTPLVIYGHSMGALLGFELARALAAIDAPPPLHLFVSGFGGPSRSSPRFAVADMTDDEFIDYLGELNGTPAEVLENPELMELMLPVLRADFELVANYRYEPGLALDCPITAIAGSDDPEVDLDELDAWRTETSRECEVIVMSGDHFFLHQQRGRLLAYVAAELADRGARTGHPPTA